MPECRAPSSVGSTSIAFLLNVDAANNEARPIECTPWPHLNPKQDLSLQKVKVLYYKKKSGSCFVLQPPDLGFVLQPLYAACSIAPFELALMHHGIRQHDGAAHLQCRHCRFESHCLMHVARGIVQHTIAFQISVVHS